MDPETLEQMGSYKDENLDALTDIAISDNGIIYLTSDYRNKVFKAEIIE